MPGGRPRKHPRTDPNVPPRGVGRPRTGETKRRGFRLSAAEIAHLEAARVRLGASDGSDAMRRLLLIGALADFRLLVEAAASAEVARLQSVNPG